MYVCGINYNLNLEQRFLIKELNYFLLLLECSKKC